MNLHMVPASVIDIASRLEEAAPNSNEQFSLLSRLAETKRFIEQTEKKYGR